MDCRKFHRDLDDYLDDGLDFAGRFGMERHAQQCIGCGKAMADAQRLHRLAQQIERVKAPDNFESRILAEIGKEKSRSGFSLFRRFWLYGVDFPSARKLALASSFLVMMGIGIFYLYPVFFGTSRPAGTPAVASQEPAKAIQMAKPLPVAAPAVEMPANRLAVPVVAKTSQPVQEPQPLSPGVEQMVDREVGESDYVEFQVMGPDNRPVSVRWPNKPRLRYGQTPEENFIRNVSH